MARGSKDAYTDKQKRQAEHIEEGYEKRIQERLARWAELRRLQRKRTSES